MRAAYRGSVSARTGPANPTRVNTRMISPSGPNTGAVSAVDRIFGISITVQQRVVVEGKLDDDLVELMVPARVVATS